jgi:hypothetical protein
MDAAGVCVVSSRDGRGGSRVLEAAGVPGEPGGVSAATVRRRLSIVSGFFAFLQARGDVPDRAVGDRSCPGGAATRRAWR